MIAPARRALPIVRPRRRHASRPSRRSSARGWTSVVVGKLPSEDEPDATADRGEDGVDLQTYLAQLPEVSGSWGSGRLLAGTAFSVVITDDGRYAAGAVAPELPLRRARLISTCQTRWSRRRPLRLTVRRRWSPAV